MTSARLLLALEGYLKPIIEANNGVFELSGTPESTLAMLRTGPQKWRCILQWLREDQIGTSSAMVMRFLVIVQQAKSLAAQAGADISRDRSGDPAILSRLTDVCDALRACKLQSNQIDPRDINPHSKYWLTDESFPSRQMAAEFSIAFGADALPDAKVKV